MNRHVWYAERALGKSILIYPIQTNNLDALKQLNETPIDVVYVTNTLEKPPMIQPYALESIDTFLLANRYILAKAKSVYCLSDALALQIDWKDTKYQVDNFVSHVIDNYRIAQKKIGPMLYITDKAHVQSAIAFVKASGDTYRIVASSDLLESFAGYPLIVDTPMNRIVAIQRSTKVLTTERDGFDTTLETECATFQVPLSYYVNVEA